MKVKTPHEELNWKIKWETNKEQTLHTANTMQTGVHKRPGARVTTEKDDLNICWDVAGLL